MKLARRPLIAGIAGSLLLVAACGTAPAPTPALPTSTPQPSPTLSPSPTPTPTATATPAATPTPTVSPTSTPATPSATAEPALTGTIEVAERGYAVTLPEGWVRIPLDEAFMDALAEELGGEAVADIRELYGDQLQSLVAAGMSLFAVRSDELGTESAANLNILSLPSGGLSLDVLEQLNVQQLEQLGTADIHTERVTLPAGEALYFRYTMESADAAGDTVDAQVHQYLLTSGTTQHVLTVTGRAGDEKLAEEAEAIAESFELLDR